MSQEIRRSNLQVIIAVIIIKSMTFYDRQEELDTLTSAVESPGSDFIVVYGRRRVGKTELLKEFCIDHAHIYFLAAQGAEQRQREKFLDQIADHFDERVPRIDSWDEAFEYLGEKLHREDLVVVIDEFPYLVAENDSLTTYVHTYYEDIKDRYLDEIYKFELGV